jgi:hypothetical protein
MTTQDKMHSIRLWNTKGHNLDSTAIWFQYSDDNLIHHISYMNMQPSTEYGYIRGCPTQGLALRNSMAFLPFVKILVQMLNFAPRFSIVANFHT